ncbi:MAG: AsmA family protein, partial [Candidatus Omnitrophica bacterium]|nr:AsmA family protein [Candidatus Omnitrophota bacterium]
MKKFLLLIVLIVVLLVAGLAVFVSTYDINKLKPKITEQLSEVVGNPVSIGHLSLHLGAGIRLAIEDFVITENNAPALQVSEVEGSLKLIPLLRKQVQVGTVKLMNPVLHLRKNPDNSIQVQGVKMPADTNSSVSPAASQNNASAKTNDAMPVELTIHRIEIRN